MANTILVDKDLFVDANDLSKTTDGIRELIVEFIDEDVASVLSDIKEKFEEMDLPQTIELTIRCSEGEDKLVLDKDELEYVEYDCIDDAIVETSMAEYSDSFYVETENERVTGYTRVGYDWEEVYYYRLAYAKFGVEYDADKGELSVAAECNCYFSIKYGSWAEGCEITREEYVSGLRTIITDKETIEALEKAISIDECSEVGLEESDDENRLTDDEKGLLISIGYFNGDDDHDSYPDTIDGYAGKMHHIGDGAYCDDDGDNWDFL